MSRDRRPLDPIARFVLAGSKAGVVQRFGLAIALVVVAALLRGGASFLSERALLFPTFYPAVLAATLYGGIRPGLAASVLSVVVVWGAFMARDDVFSIPDSDQIFNMFFFVAMAYLLVWIAASYRRLVERLQAEDERRNLLVLEIQHRNRNTLAVAQSIVSQGLKSNRDAARDINGRLAALARANELLLAAPDLSVPFADIARSALFNYESHRYAIGGAPVLFRDQQARSMGLILHELATNAAKYGALSSLKGRISVTCEQSNGETIVRWEEEGGPAISPPATSGFGTRFIDVLAADLKAKTDRSYREEGLIFELRLSA